MARFVVLVIDSFGVGAMKDVTLVRPQDAGANQRIGLCTR